MNQPRIGFVSVIRPAFKGDSRRVLHASLDGLGALADELEFHLVDAGSVVADAADAEAVARRLRGEGLAFLLIQLTTFATGDVVAPLLDVVPRVGVWAIPESAGGRGAGGPLPLNSLCGVTMILSLLDAPQVPKTEPAKWFYGTTDDADFRQRLATTVAALRGLEALQSARVLAIGGTAPGFYGIDEVPSLSGIRVVRAELSDLFDRIAAVDRADVLGRARHWARRERVEVAEDDLERTARIDLALEGMARDAGADALAVRCWPELPERVGAMACAAIGDSGGREVPAACEGDIMGALSMLAVQGVTGAPAVLMDLSDIDDQDDSLQVWHCGNGPLDWAAPDREGVPDTRLTAHFNRDGVGVVRDMRLRAGPVSGFRLLSEGRRAVVVGGAIRHPDKAGFDGVRGWITDLRWGDTPLGVRAFVANLLDRRLPHHLAFGMGDRVDALLELSAHLRAEVVRARPQKAYLRP